MKTIFSVFSSAGRDTSLFVALTIVNSIAFANVTNDGATITILSGTTVTVLGDVDNKVGSIITNNGIY